MKKRIIILLLILPLVLTSCSELITVLARINNIDSEETELKLHFDFRRMYKEELSKVNRIEIYRNDSLICNLYSKTAIGISEWDFPSIPNDFEIGQSISDSIIPMILKTQDIRFEFVGGVKFPGYGSWVYKSKYSKPEYRWLFDVSGNQKERIDCFYEPWVGKDIVKIESTEEFYVIDSLFKLQYQNGTQINFELKYKRNPTNKVALILENAIKTGEKIELDFKLDSIRNYKELIQVPDKSIVGVSGKYNDL